MSATVLQGIHILTTDDPIAESASSLPAIIVLGAVHDEDQAASDARWNFLFIGSLEEFHQSFTHRMTQEFDHRKYMNQHYRPIRGSDFIRQLNSAIERATTLTAMELRKRGITAVTWSQNDAEALGITELPMIAKVPFFMDCRYGFEIRDSSDAQRLVLYALKLKQIAQERGCYNPLYTGRPMLEQSARMRSDQAYRESSER